MADLGSFLQNFKIPLVTSAAVALALTAPLLWFITARLQERRKRTRGFVNAGQVYELFVYPIKSCKANKVEWIDCGKRGASNGEEFDRHFLVVDSLQDNLFLTARIYPKMVLIGVRIKEGKLRVEFGSADKFVEVDLAEVRGRGQIRRARLFADSRTEGFDCGDQIGEAFDEFLGVKGKRALRLIWFGDEEILYTERDVHTKSEYWLNNPVPELQDSIAFQDLASYMAFSLNSVSDLNKHLASESAQIDQRNFRPTIVVSGTSAFDEDSWLRVRAGEAEFICYKPCTRCVLTTVNPDTGEKSAKMEPLKTLRKYRLAPGKLYEQYKDSPIFGVNMAIVKTGTVRVGDPVFIQYKSKPF